MHEGGPQLTISPQMGTMFGGTPVAVSGPTFSETSIIVCSFGGNESPGVYINDDVALCVTPAFESAGWISLSVTIKLTSGVIIYTGQDCFYSGKLFLATKICHNIQWKFPYGSSDPLSVVPLC